MLLKKVVRYVRSTRCRGALPWRTCRELKPAAVSASKYCGTATNDHGARSASTRSSSLASSLSVTPANDRLTSHGTGEPFLRIERQSASPILVASPDRVTSIPGCDPINDLSNTLLRYLRTRRCPTASCSQSRRAGSPSRYLKWSDSFGKGRSIPRPHPLHTIGGAYPPMGSHCEASHVSHLIGNPFTTTFVPSAHASQFREASCRRPKRRSECVECDLGQLVFRWSHRVVGPGVVPARMGLRP